jgi:hypothetical protein
MRYVHARQQLGPAVVLCDEPEAFAAVARKQWLRLSRTLQRQRTASSDAAKILAFTHAITRMQQTELVACLPEERPDAAVYFVTAQELRMIAIPYPTLCVAGLIAPSVAAEVIGQLPSSSMIVDYTGQLELGDYGLLARGELDKQIPQAWQRITSFLTGYGVDVASLSLEEAYALGTFDDAVDTLLGVHNEFLSRAAAFQHTLELARPLRTYPKARLDQYEVVIRLANQVQSLTPGYAHLSFMEGVLSDTFFFNDRRPRTSTLAELIAYHRQAGRLRLAGALQRMAAPPQSSFTSLLQSGITITRTLSV